MIFTVFEDNNYNSLFPLNLNRASFELRCGAFTNLERIENLLQPDDSIQLVVRDGLKLLIQERYPKCSINPEILSPGIWLNGRGLWFQEILDKISIGKSYTSDGTVVAIHNQKDVTIQDIHPYLEKAGSVSTALEIHQFKNIWDGIFLQSEIINRDAHQFLDYKKGKIHPSVILENGDNIFIGEEAEIRAGTVLDAKSGPIIFAENVYIDIGALIQGPAYIGPQCKINPGAKLRGNVTLGPMCKIGGEVEDVIFQGYGNKQHDGFLGHSYLGEWVNLGANTNNSDLKNNYSMIKLTVEDKTIETGKQFLGTMMGDYVRTGICTMLNTGTVIGLGANVFGEGFQEKYIPSFKWGKDGITKLDQFINTAEKMMERRSNTMSQEEKRLLTVLYEKLI